MNYIQLILKIFTHTYKCLLPWKKTNELPVVTLSAVFRQKRASTSSHTTSSLQNSFTPLDDGNDISLKYSVSRIFTALLEM